MQPDAERGAGDPADQGSVATARAIVEVLGSLIQDADAGKLDMLAYLLGMARIEAEEIVAKRQPNQDR